METNYDKLEKHCEIFSGYAFKSQDLLAEGDIPVVKIGNISNGKDVILDKDTQYVDKKFLSINEKFHIKKGDVLISLTGSHINQPNSMVGRSCRYYQNRELLLNQRAGKILAKKNNDLSFLYYMFTSWAMKVSITNRAYGAANQANVSPTDISNIKFNFPNYEIQKKIANILSRYDEAIENNNKRIKLLEQMAQNLYKEWFVRFRFPGWENAEFENGIPKGWYQGRFSELFEFKRGKNITVDEMIEGQVPVISAGISPSGYHIEANVKGTSLTISSSGANAGYLSIHYEDIWAADCMFITEENTKNIYYLYELLNNIRPVILNQQRGAAQPHVYSKDINNLRLWIPNEELRENANVLFESFHKEIYQLQQANKNLVQQRDLLLPRLMSGKLEV